MLARALAVLQDQHKVFFCDHPNVVLFAGRKGTLANGAGCIFSSVREFSNQDVRHRPFEYRQFEKGTNVCVTHVVCGFVIFH